MPAKLVLIMMLVAGQSPVESKPSGKPDAPPRIPQRVQQMAGRFTGTWTSFSYKDGHPVKRASWTDALICDKPTRVGNKTIVEFHAESTFPGQSRTRKRQWKEGYFLNDEGGLADRYVEYFGTVYRLKQISPTTWVYALPMASTEFAQMGFPGAIRGEHVIIVSEQTESGVDTRRMTRLTSVVHKNKDGKEITTQFVSLRGFHKRRP